MTEHVAEVDIKSGVFHYHNQTHVVLSTPVVVVRWFLVSAAAVMCFAFIASCTQHHISRSIDQSFFAVLTILILFDFYTVLKSYS